MQLRKKKQLGIVLTYAFKHNDYQRNLEENIILL